MRVSQGKEPEKETEKAVEITLKQGRRYLVALVSAETRPNPLEVKIVEISRTSYCMEFKVGMSSSWILKKEFYKIYKIIEELDT